MRALILGCASIAVVCVSQAPAAALAQERAPTIDMHLHADLPLYHNANRFLRLAEGASGARPSMEE